MIIEGDEVDPTPEVTITVEEDHMVVSFEPDENFGPAFLLKGEILPEAFRMQMGSVVPYFLESILAEAGVDYAYEEIETGLIDEDYISSIGFYLRRKDLPGFFDTVRNSGAATIYDFVFQLEDRTVVLTHDDRLLVQGFDRAELEEAREAFTSALDELEDGETEEPVLKDALDGEEEDAEADDGEPAGDVDEEPGNADT